MCCVVPYWMKHFETSKSSSGVDYAHTLNLERLYYILLCIYYIFSHVKISVKSCLQRVKNASIND